LRRGYCLGQFNNSDNCAAGGSPRLTALRLFCELFEPRFQPWTGGGEAIFHSSTNAWQPSHYHECFGPPSAAARMATPSPGGGLMQIHDGFAEAMTLGDRGHVGPKLGLIPLRPHACERLLSCLVLSKVDYTIFFARLSTFPSNSQPLKAELLPAQFSEATRCAVDNMAATLAGRIHRKRRQPRDIRSDEARQPPRSPGGESADARLPYHRPSKGDNPP